MNDLPLFSAREAARATDPVTSVMAAESIAAHVHSGQMRALRHFYEQNRPLDDFQLSDYTGVKQTSIGKRRGELERMGYVEKAERRVSPSRSTTSVVQSYRITEAGRRFYREQTEKK